MSVLEKCKPQGTVLKTVRSDRSFCPVYNTNVEVIVVEEKSCWCDSVFS